MPMIDYMRDTLKVLVFGDNSINNFERRKIQYAEIK